MARASLAGRRFSERRRDLISVRAVPTDRSAAAMTLGSVSREIAEETPASCAVMDSTASKPTGAGSGVRIP
jgi:hypothetical protein